jgi:hypothetical protein
LPNTIVLDTKPPLIKVPHPIYTHISPGVPNHGVFSVPYSVSEPAHGILYVDGKQLEFTYKEPLHGVLQWGGEIHGRPARAGNHVLEISAQDLAGNRAKPFPFAVVAIRYIELGRSRIFVRPGARFALLVLTDSRCFNWQLHGRHGLACRHTLRLQAPKRPGVYRLYVEAVEHVAKALVVIA